MGRKMLIDASRLSGPSLHDGWAFDMLAAAFLAAIASRGLGSVNVDVDATGSGPAGDKIWPNFVG